MSLARERRMLDDHLAMARSHLETATDAIKAGGSEPLLWARSAAESYVRALEAAVEKHVKAFGELTPLQVPTSGSSQSFRADSRDAVAGTNAFPSLWHQTPELLNVPHDEPWANGAAP